MAEVNYTIPLDSIDLMYLSKYVQTPNADKKLLWTKRNLDGETEYCEVKIVSQDRDEDCYAESMDTYKCHICNIHVPVMCSREHDETEKHVTLKNIFQKVLGRVSKQISPDIISNDNTIDKDVYYCEPCSKIIKIKNKNKHESSNYHIKSLRDISTAHEFYKIFKEKCFDQEEELMVEDNGLESEFINPSTSNNNYVINDDNLNESTYNILDSDDDSVDQLPITTNLTAIQGLSSINPETQLINDNKKENFAEYLKAMIEKYNINVNVPEINGEQIWIMTPNGDTVKVSSEHFQSYRYLKNTIYCQLCKMWISMETRPHDVTEIHVRNIFKPINEKFARIIDAVSSHCVPCNEVVLTASNHHTLNDEHKRIINDTRRPKTGKTFCEDCKIFIDTHNFAVHIKSKKHLNVLIQLNSIEITNNENIYVCNICNLTVPKHNIKSHIDSKTHTEKKANYSTETNDKNNDSLEKNSKNNDSLENTSKKNDFAAVDVNLEPEYCATCKVKVPRYGMKIHVAGKPHKQVLSEMSSNSKNVLKTEENTVQSGVKPDSVAYNDSSMSNNNQNSSITSSEIMSSTTSIFSNTAEDDSKEIDAYYAMTEYTDDSRTQVRCKVCSVNITFCERNIIEHMKGRNHKEQANKQKSTLYFKLLLFTDVEKTKVKCEVCDVQVPYLERNVVEHMEGRNHVAVENYLLQYHLVTRKSWGYVCKCCDVQINDYLDHINSKTHINNFLMKKKIDKIEMRKYVYEDNVNDNVARLQRNLHRNLLKYNQIHKLNDSEYYCLTCNITLGRISEIYHVLGERHRCKLQEASECRV